MVDRDVVARLRQRPDLLVAAAVGLFVVIAAIIAIVVVVSRGGKKPPPTPPVTGPMPAVIELSGWKLSYPVENDEGHPTQIEPAATVAPWMVAEPTGGLLFWAPSQGVTTENSSHPRTELQSLSGWNAGQSAHTMRASVTLLQVPRDGEGIILGQIHGRDDISSVPYVMLRYQNGPGHQGGTVRVVVKQVQDGDDAINYPLLSGLGMNTRFDFGISDLGNGQMVFTATRDGKTEQVTAPVPEEFVGATVRFQAGDYQQSDKPAGGTDGGKVIFHQLVQQTP